MRYLAPVLIAAAGAIHAQQEVRVSAKPYAPSALTLRVQSDLVEVGVVVRGHNGHAIAGLQKADFQILDHGAPRDIASFAVETAADSVSISGTASAPVTAGAPPAAPPPGARLPRFIALYFDDFGTNSGDLKHAQVAARGFVNQGLDAGDRVAVVASSGNVLDFTDDKSKLLAAIDKVRPHPRFSEGGQSVCPRITPYQAYQIAVLFDEIALNGAMDEAKGCTEAEDDSSSYSRRNDQSLRGQMIKAQAETTWNQVKVVSLGTIEALRATVNNLASKPGRRLLLLVSSGFISGTLERERDGLINLALHSNIVINALDAKGLYAESPIRPLDEPSGLLSDRTYMFETRSIGDKVVAANEAMSDLAQATGGLFFHNNNDLPAGFRLLGSLPEVSYVLGFHPGDSTDEKYHKLKVRLTASKSYVIEARPGYFALPKAAPAPPDRKQRLDREVMSDSVSNDFPTTMTYLPGGPAVKVQFHVDIRELQFPKRDERRVQQLEMVVALLDARGNLVASKEGIMDFALTDATYARLSANGINASLNLDVPPGVYRLRGVVQDAVDGKMASSVQAIEVK